MTPLRSRKVSPAWLACLTLLWAATSNTARAEEAMLNSENAQLRQQATDTNALRHYYESRADSNPLAISTYRRNYILPIAYDTHLPNLQQFNEVVGGKPNHNELKYQISLKINLADDVFGRNGDLFLGYTQYSLWQAYNENSAPFRETNYEPELFLRFDNSAQLYGWTNTFNRIGLLHQSNGRGGDLSRSWNRLYVESILQRGPWTVGATSWYRLPEPDDSDDNPDIEKYIGYGDLTLMYTTAEGHELSALLRTNPLEGRYSEQLDYAFPMFGRVRGYLQYYHGYGESLIDYNRRVNRIGIGFSFNPLIPGAPGGSFNEQKAEHTPLAWYDRRNLFERLSDANPFALSSYHRNYMLPISYNSAPMNHQHFDQLVPGVSPDSTENKFQISLKTHLWTAPFGIDGDLYGAYTQMSWWQAYNRQASSLFRETNYEPALFLSLESDHTLWGWQNTHNDIGFVHQSNGRAGELSRSWNRLFLESHLRNGSWYLKVRPWWRIPETRDNDDNPNIDHYLGYADATLGFNHNAQEITWTVRGNPFKGTISHQIDYSFPLVHKVHGYLQYYNGYGESMIDYDQRVNRIGIGLSFSPEFL